MSRAVAALLTMVLVIACSSPPANVPASGGTTVTGPGELPPITAVWFGTAFDPATMALTDKGSTFKAGAPVVAIGTLLSARPPEELSVAISTGGSVRKTLPVGPGVGNTFGVDLGAMSAGNYLVQFQDKARKNLASSSVTITP